MWNSLRVRIALLTLTALAIVMVTAVSLMATEGVAGPTVSLPLEWQLVWWILVILVLGLAWLSLVQFVRPLRILTEMVQQIGRGNYHAAERPTFAVRELEQLRGTLDQMAHKILDDQAALESYIERLTQVEEHERTQLARALHDGTLQDLVVLDQKADQLRHELRAFAPAGTERLTDIQNLVQKIDAALRQVETELRPPILDDLGLVACLEEAAKGVGAEFQVTGEEQPFSSTRALELLKMVKEVLRNADRHADAEWIELKVLYSREAVTVTIQDNGVGFEVPPDRTAFARTRHFGLMDLDQCARKIHATLEIESAPKTGTRVTIRVPLSSDE
jgi:signal transduction histidine kinase